MKRLTLDNRTEVLPALHRRSVTPVAGAVRPFSPQAGSQWQLSHWMIGRRPVFVLESSVSYFLSFLIVHTQSLHHTHTPQ